MSQYLIMNELILQASGVFVSSCLGSQIRSELSNVIFSETSVDIAGRDFVTINAVSASGTNPDARINFLSEGPISLRAFLGSGTLEYVAYEGWKVDGKTFSEMIRDELCRILHCE